MEHALADSYQTQSGIRSAHDQRIRTEPNAIVAHRHDDRARDLRNGHLTDPGVRMADDVRQRLLDGAIDGQLECGRQTPAQGRPCEINPNILPPTNRLHVRVDGRGKTELFQLRGMQQM